MTNLDSVLNSRHHLAEKSPYSKGYDLSSSRVWMWELDHKESWALKNLCFWTVVLEKTLENPLNSKEIKPVYPKRNQTWIFTGRTDTEAGAPVLWPPDVKRWLIGKVPDAGKDWRQEKGKTEMVDDAVQPSHPLSPPSPVFNLSQHQGLFQSVGSSHQVTKVLELQLQHQSFQWIFRTDFL